MVSLRAPSFPPCDAWSIKGRHFHSRPINSNQTNTTKQTSEHSSKWGSHKVRNRPVFVSPNQYVVSFFFIINCASFGKCTWTCCCCLSCWVYVYVGACHLLSGFSPEWSNTLWECLALKWKGVHASLSWASATWCAPLHQSDPLWNDLTRSMKCFIILWIFFDKNVSLGSLVTQHNSHHWLGACM